MLNGVRGRCGKLGAVQEREAETTLGWQGRGTDACKVNMIPIQ